MSEIKSGRLGLYGTVKPFENLGFKGLITHSPSEIETKPLPVRTFLLARWWSGLNDRSCDGGWLLGRRWCLSWCFLGRDAFSHRLECHTVVCAHRVDLETLRFYTHDTNIILLSIFNSSITSLSSRLSSTQQLLHVPYLSTNFGRRAFSYSSPATRNSIPTSIKNCSSLYSFKRHL